MFSACGMPVLAPADVQDILDFGLLGWAMSRYAGLWVGFKLEANVVESSATVLLLNGRSYPIPTASDRAALGYGDVKLLGMIGAFLGPWPTLAVVMIGSIFGSIIGIGLMITQGRGFRTQLPFGPFLAVGGIIVLFFSDTLLARWLPGLGL